MSNPSIAIIQFPGSNSEYDTQYAAEAVGIKADLIRWTQSNTQDLLAYDGYILPGGFSYQDRVRAGVIAAKLPILSFLKEANAQNKPILGICNGCQILAETGLIPDISGTATLEAALAPNYQNGRPIGFKHDWLYVRVKNKDKSLFSLNLPDDIGIPSIISHGEGRFVFSEDAKKQLDQCTVYYYSKADGSLDTENPNGAYDNIAGVCNPKGNVMAIMPHPERAFFIRQLPAWMNNDWSNQKHNRTWEDTYTPWKSLFTAMKSYMENPQ